MIKKLISTIFLAITFAIIAGVIASEVSAQVPPVSKSCSRSATSVAGGVKTTANYEYKYEHSWRVRVTSITLSNKYDNAPWFYLSHADSIWSNPAINTWTTSNASGSGTIRHQHPTSGEVKITGSSFQLTPTGSCTMN